MKIAIQVAETPLEREGCLRILMQALDFVLSYAENLAFKKIPVFFALK